MRMAIIILGNGVKIEGYKSEMKNKFIL